jgi:DNA ligase-1
MEDALLKQINEFVDEVNKENSKNYKVEVIKKWIKDPNIKTFLRYMMDPKITLGITESCLDIDVGDKDEEDNILSLLIKLGSRNVTGHAAAALCKGYLKANAGFETTFRKILNKDLKIGINSKLMHKIDPNAFPLFEVALATDIKKVKEGVSFLASKEHLLMRKLDGVRCIAMVSSNDVRFFSRKGQYFSSLSKLEKALLEALPKNSSLVLDGEICVMADGKEDFKAASGQVRKLDEQMENPHYVIFDCLSYTEFIEGTSSRKFSDRLNYINRILQPNDFCSVIKTTKYTKEDLDKLWEEASTKGWEGLIARADTVYKSGRSKDLLKLKFFDDDEFEITGVDAKVQGVLVGDKIVPTEMVGALKFNYKGNEVKCGTGFSLQEAMDWWKHPEKIIGKLCTIQYQGESQDKDGKYSLRIPSFKGIRGDLKQEEE